MSSNASIGQRAIPASLIKKRLVDNVGKAYLVANDKLSRTEDHQVSFAFEISPFGKDLKNSHAFWTGPISPIKIAESDLFNGGSDSVYFTWMADPMVVEFAPNQFVSKWGDGQDSIKGGYIQMTPENEVQNFVQNPHKSWCYRFVVVAKSYDEFEVVLETLPVSLETLKKCPWAASLATGAMEADKWRAGCTQGLPTEYGPGILPYLQDDRLPQYQKECLLPTSATIRRTVWETLSLMGSSPGLEDEEMVGYDPSKKKKAPLFPDIPRVEESSSGTKRKLDQDSPIEQSTTKTGKKWREYVPREIWVLGKPSKKHVPKRKVLPVNRPETQKYTSNPPKG